MTAKWSDRRLAEAVATALRKAAAAPESRQRLCQQDIERLVRQHKAARGLLEAARAAQTHFTNGATVMKELDEIVPNDEDRDALLGGQID